MMMMMIDDWLMIDEKEEDDMDMDEDGWMNELTHKGTPWVTCDTWL